MAFSIKKYNKGNNRFNIDTKNLKYRKLKELHNDEIVAHEDDVDIAPGHVTYVIGALFVNTKSKYGDSPAAVVMDVNPATGEMVPAFIASLPTHCAETVREMLEDEEAVDAIKNFRVGFTIREYETKTYKITAYAPEWCDVNDD